jgi:hypothetical protein
MKTHGGRIPERHEQWVGVQYVEEHGYPFFPPPHKEIPSVEELRERHNTRQRAYTKRRTEKRKARRLAIAVDEL